MVSCLALVLAGMLGITLSVPLQAPAVVLIGLAGVLAGLCILARKDGSEGRGVLIVAFVSIAYFVLRACTSPVWDLAIEDLVLIFSAGILYLIAGYAVRGKEAARFRQGLAWVVVILLVLHLGAALMQLVGGEGYSLSRYVTSAIRSSSGRVTGMYGYYGSFANFAVIAGLLCLSLGVWGRMAYHHRGLMFLLGLVAMALAVWSRSRSATLSLIVALVVFGVMVFVSLTRQKESVQFWATRAFLLLSVCGVLAGLAAGVWVFKQRGGVSMDMISDSGVRTQFWAMAGEQWVDYPLFGAGSRSYSYECFRYWSPNLPTEQANPEFVHNEYLQLLADYGLMGLMLIIILFAGHLFVGGKRVRQLSEDLGENGLKQGSNAMALAIAGVCGMVAMAVHICFDFRTHLLANLLLLVCCAVWVLPVAKSTVGKSGSREVWGSRIGGWVLALMMIVLGMGAMGLGGQQLWGGLPLIKNKMAKEDGTWVSGSVDRSIWIPALEKAVDRAPHYVRYQKLGTLYRLESDDLIGEEQAQARNNAIKYYLLSLERHPAYPVASINLAAIYAEGGQYEKADEYYSRASERAKARERWFRMHSQWAKLHQQWAIDLWKNKEFKNAEEHFLRAKELYQASYDYGYFYMQKKWVVEYTQLLITYAGLLDEQQRYTEAELLLEEGRKQVNWYNWQTETKLNVYYARHLLYWGRHVWNQRKPGEAYTMMKKAKQLMLQYRGVMNGEVDKPWQEQMNEIQQVIDFLDQTGEGK